MLFGICGVCAQESLNSSGGEATGIGASSFSIGQVFYTSNKGNSGSANQGIQNAYDLKTLWVVESAANISLSVYPNPTNDILHLKVQEASDFLSCQLYSAQGVLIETKPFTSTSCSIDASAFPKATYILRVLEDENQIQTFQIIKN